MQVPFIDLRTPHRVLRDDLNEAIQRVLDRCDFALGQDVQLLEEEFAQFCGTRHAIGVGSGLAALELSLRAFGVGEGHEVIIPAHTFTATAAAVSFAGAVPVLVDVDPETYNIDTRLIEAAITPRTRAIIPVHLYGLPANMDAIMSIAAKHNLFVVEDACQSHGATYKDRRTGSLGHAAAFSFYPTKNLGGAGDGGIIVTDDDEVAEAARAMRNCGQRVKNQHELPPFNHRLDTIQAAVLRVKLRHLDEWNLKRRQAAQFYNELLADSNMILPVETAHAQHVYHLYVIRTPQRDMLREHLNAQGIGSAIHYPHPIHKQPFYSKSPIRYGELPHAEKLVDEILSLPMFPEITQEQITYVASHIKQFSPVPEM